MRTVPNPEHNPEHKEWIKWAALLITVAYTALFIWKMMENYLAWRSVGRSVEWVVADNPRTLIILCLIFATIALWSLEHIGKLVALIMFGIMLVRFYQWGASTASIKANAGLQTIPESNWVGNIWLGGGWWELLLLLAGVVLLLANTWSLWKNRAALTLQWRRGIFSHP